MQKPLNLVLVLAATAGLLGFVFFLTAKRPAPPKPPQSSAALESPTRNPRREPGPVPGAPPAVSEPEEAVYPGLPALPRDKVESYLARRGRGAANLLAAFHGTHDTNYLLEAARNFPEDPAVQWTVLERNLFPQDRRRWLDAFKTSSPSNALPSYVSAHEYFEKGDTNAAVRELLAASGKPQFENYFMTARLDAEELFLSCGQSPLQASQSAMAGTSEELLPELAMSKRLVQSIAGLQSQSAAAADADSAAQLTRAGLALADQLRSGESGKSLINVMVGNADEAILLHQLDPNTAYDFLGGKTPTQRLNDLKQQKEEFKQLSREFSAAFPTLTEAQEMSYVERSKIYGEAAAMRWLHEQLKAAGQAQ
jgi:hypothetical protein